MQVRLADISLRCEIGIFELSPGWCRICRTTSRVCDIGRSEESVQFHKALYGLKQAPMAYNKKIDSYLVELGFIKCKSEYGVYVQVMT